MARRPLLPLLLIFVPSAIAAADTPGGTGGDKPRYTLEQLVKMAHRAYPGLEAARHAIGAMEQQVYRARWGWLPQGTVKGLLAPAPELHCLDAGGQRNAAQCVQTTSVDVDAINISGVMGRIVLEVGMPLYTFDKLGSAKRAAAAGLEIKKAQLQAAEDDLELKLTQAFWAVKLAREMLYTVNEGRKYLDKALDRIERQLDEDEGDATVTDLLRLKTAAAEIDARTAEAEKLEALTLAGLATLTGQRAGSFDLDKAVLALQPGKLGPVATYVDLAKQNRPEVRLLQWAVRARRAAADLETARFFPDFLLVGTLGYGATNSVDDPENAFYSDPFNFVSAGFGLALSWKLDTIQQVGKLRAARAEAAETEARQKEALAGIDLEIRGEHIGISEALKRLEATKRGQKAARSWLVATAQNLDAGLAEPKDLTDALLAYFQLRLRNLQAIFDINVGWAKLGKAVGAAARHRAQGPNR